MATAFAQKDKLDTLLTDYHGNRPGAAVMIIYQGKPLLTRTYGMADLENNIPVTSSTNFRLASVTKQFTAAAILQLVQAGKLHLDQKMNALFPGFPAYGSKITLQHLLNHTSGLPDYEDHVPDTAFNPQLRDTEVLAILQNLDSLYFEPGSRYRYSNSAYALLALLVEKVSGKDFSQYLHDHLFTPSGMATSVAYIKGENEIANCAFGYSRQQEQWTRKDQSSTSAVLGDGGIYSSLEDLFHWDQALYGDNILPNKIWEQAFTPGTLINGDTITYGYGWHLKTWLGDKVVYHTGSTTSFRNIFYRIPGKSLSLVLLTNRNVPRETEMVLLAEEILQWAKTNYRLP